ncbi:MAG: SDR family NAD(P)-dependent oxidoreductase [Chloroflexi bacterium]|nr:SDR family NAD(P)-dependent oxidoreductase [Chloroflexota bacterium]
MSLEGRVALITGASRGLGKAMALTFARAGADIVVAARSETQPHPQLPGTIYETAEAVRALGRRALPVRCDITKPEDIDAAVAKALEEFGKIDILVHNAAVRVMGSLAEMPLRRWDLMLNGNFRAAVGLVKGVLPSMQQQGWGHILVVAPKPDPEAARGEGLAYGLSKAAASLFVLGAAQELAGYGIAINCLWPEGARDSEGTRMFRPLDPKNTTTADLFADAALVIVSKDPSVRTGQALDDETVLRAEGMTDFSRYALELSTSS